MCLSGHLLSVFLDELVRDNRKCSRVSSGFPITESQGSDVEANPFQVVFQSTVLVVFRTLIFRSVDGLNCVPFLFLSFFFVLFFSLFPDQSLPELFFSFSLSLFFFWGGGGGWGGGVVVGFLLGLYLLSPLIFKVFGFYNILINTRFYPPKKC